MRDRSLGPQTIPLQFCPHLFQKLLNLLAAEQNAAQSPVAMFQGGDKAHPIPPGPQRVGDNIYFFNVYLRIAVK